MKGKCFFVCFDSLRPGEEKKINFGIEEYKKQTERDSKAAREKEKQKGKNFLPHENFHFIQMVFISADDGMRRKKLRRN